MWNPSFVICFCFVESGTSSLDLSALFYFIVHFVDHVTLYMCWLKFIYRTLMSVGNLWRFSTDLCSSHWNKYFKRGDNFKENSYCGFFWLTTMSEENYFRASWAGSAFRNEQVIPENRWKRVTGKYLHEPVLSVSTRLVNVSQFRKQDLAGCPRGQTCFLCASILTSSTLQETSARENNVSVFCGVIQRNVTDVM